MRTWLDEILLSNRAILQPNKEFNCLPTLIYRYYYRYAKTNGRAHLRLRSFHYVNFV